jgi:hypothetical protein
MLALGKDENEVLYGIKTGVSPAMMNRLAFVQNLQRSS